MEEDVLRRLGAVETAVLETRTQVASIAATLPHLATKDDVTSVRTEVAIIAAIIPHLATKDEVTSVRTEVASIAAVVPHLATKADLKEEIGGVRAEVAELGAKLIRWMIATAIALGGLVATLLKLVH